MVLPLQDKVECSVFQTLGRHRTSRMETCFVFCFLSFIYVGVLGHDRPPLGGILQLYETPDRFCGSENVYRGSVDIRVSCIWGKFEFRVNYPFKSIKDPHIM